MKKMRVVTASTRKGMMSEAEITNYFNRELRLYARTGKEKFLEAAMVLQEVLGIPDTEADELLDKYLDTEEKSKYL